MLSPVRSDQDPVSLALGGMQVPNEVIVERVVDPMWDRFQALRRRLDPDAKFLNTYLRDVMGG